MNPSFYMRRILARRTRSRAAFPIIALAVCSGVFSACRTRAFNSATIKKNDGSETEESAPSPDQAGCRKWIAEDTLRRWDAERAAVGAPTVTMAIVGLNDLHGHIETQELVLAQGNKQRKVHVGGLGAMAAYLTALCEKYKGNVVVLDAGDAYQGTMVSNLTEGEAIVSAYNTLGVHASTFGNHEFDYGQDALRRILARPRSFLYLSANLRDAKDKSKLPWDEDRLKHLHKSAIVKLGGAGGIKVGIIGMTTLTTPLKTLPDRVSGLAFVPPRARTGADKEGVIATEATRLRKLGANVIVLLGHAGGKCDMHQVPEAGDSACDPQNDELYEFLKESAGVVDAAFGGHSHNAQRHFIGGPQGRPQEGVPLMQSTGFGRSFSWLELEVAVGAAAIAPRGARIIAMRPKDPLFLCHEHFADYASCNPRDPEWGREFPSDVFSGSTQNPMFDDKPVDPRNPRFAAAEAVLEPFVARVRSLQNEPIATLPERLDHEREAESALGNCYVDAVTEQVAAKAKTLSPARHIDLMVMNSGGIRTGLPEGLVKYEQIYAALPFDNTVVAFELTAEELLRFLRKIESSPEDLPYVPKGFSITLTKSTKAPRTIALLENGKPPAKDRRFGVATSEFSALFAEGVLGKEEFARRQFAVGATVRDAFAERLRHSPVPASCQQATIGRHVLVE